MVDSTCWIGQEYWLAGDKQKQRREQAWGKSLRRLNRTTQTTHPQMGGWEGKTFDKSTANSEYTAQQNCKLNLEQFAYAFIARQCLLT